MENIQRFCGLASNDTFLIWDKDSKIFSDCFLWIVPSFISHSLFITCCAYLFGISQRYRRITTYKESWLMEILCILLAVLSLLEVILSYVLKQVHPPAYVLSRTMSTASWMLCFCLLIKTRTVFRRRKKNNTVILIFSILIFVSSSMATYSLVKIISDSNNLHFEKWPVMYYGVFLYFFLNLCFVLSSIGMCFVKLKQTLFNRTLPSLVGNRSIQVDDDAGPLVESGASSQASYYKAYMKHKEERTDIFLGQGETNQNKLSKLLFWWCNKLVLKGYHQQLNTPEDLFMLPSSLDTGSIKERFSSMLKRQRHVSVFKELRTESILEYNSQRKKKPYNISILKTMNKAFGKGYYSLGVLKFMVDCLGFAGPLLLNYLVKFMENKQEPMAHGYYYALGLFLSTLFSVLLGAHYLYQVQKVGLKIRAGLVTTIYEKTLSVSTSTLNHFSTGQIVNYMSTDTDRIVNFVNSFHEFWSLPFQVAVCLFLLYQQLGISFLAGVGVILLLVPVNRQIAVKIGELSKKMMKQKDDRVKIISEVLFGIRIIKLYAWENHFKKKVNEAREKELNSLKWRKYLDALCVFFWATTSIWISIFTFTLYVLLGHELTAAKVFTSIALFNILIPPINAFPWVVNGLMEAWVSLKRVEKFLSSSEIRTEENYIRTLNDDGGDDIVIELDRASFSWKESGYVNIEPVESLKNLKQGRDDESSRSEQPTDEDYTITKPFCLKKVNLHVEKGQLIGVSGEVGSGKSSLFAALTAEMEKDNGYIYLDEEFKGFAYVAQEPWIQHMSIRDNILFGRPYDQDRYEEVLYACALNEDLDQLPGGDNTEVGENGVNLSGGQKARIGLARAVYQDKDVYLLDDPLAAVDPHVASHLFDHCIVGLLKYKTRLLATHHTKYLWKADNVIVFKEGEVIATGPPEGILEPEQLNFQEQDSCSSVETGIAETNVSSSKDRTENDQLAGKLVEDEHMEKGHVALQVYKCYWKAVGNCLSPLIILFVCLMTGSKYIGDWWLAYWISQERQHDESTVYHLYRTLSDTTSNSSSDNVKFYLSVYGGIAASNSVLALFRAFLFAYGGVKAAKHFHKKLLDSILKAPVSFFDVTPIGRIINRFSSDTYAVDDSLPFITNIVLAQATAVLGTIIITCYGIPWFTAVLVPLGAIYYYTQQYYRRTSRELKRLSSVTLSPVYEHFSETLSGLMTIRAFKESVRFATENERKLDFSQRANYSALVASIWLLLRLNFIGVVMVTAVAFLAVIEHHFNSINPGLVGLAISYALSITGLLSGLVKFFTETEKEMVSVERVMEYIERTPEEKPDAFYVDQYCSLKGAICFRNVCFRYRDNLPLALDDVSFFVKAGEKIGICGRTGSGKSSLFRLLFKIMDVTSGEIIIDGVDLKTIGIQQARSKMSIIPQDPFLFDDTIRNNLDPKQNHAMFEIDDVLTKCHLIPLVESLGGLSAMVGERGCNLSAGQKQLMCLARALLKNSRIICIDEATANVDMATDKQIQETIRNELRTSTVLTIAHRIETIMDCDRVLVMNNGRLAEFAPPNDLLSDHESLFFSLVRENNRQKEESISL